MDKQEVKEEHKQNDLPAEVKGAMRRRQMQAARARMMADVPQADVVVTNPTHYAVALRYDPDKSAPEVVAKGVDLVAKRIREIARDAGVPIVADPPLARSLHASRRGRSVRSPRRCSRPWPSSSPSSTARPAGGSRMNAALLQKLTKHTDLLAAGGRRARRRDDDRPAAADAAGPVHHPEHLGGAGDRRLDDVPRRRRSSSASFPSLLLLTTLFRLAINVSVTRLILLEGDAGHVVEAFGDFVVGGNVVVGLVIFLILDRHPVRRGHQRRRPRGRGRRALHPRRHARQADGDRRRPQRRPDHRGPGARAPRATIAREADFYGAMDGASKFVKGDAMAAILITLINLLGGIIVGVVQQGMPFGDAASHFSLLTVGDGLAAQIPALLISVATGIIVTRSTSEKDLGNDIAGQIFRQRKAPMVAGAVICLFALVPGAAQAAVPAHRRRLRRDRLDDARRRPAGATCSRPRRAALEADGPQAELPRRRRRGASARCRSTRSSWRSASASCRWSTRAPAARCCRRVGVVRRQIAAELGMVISPVRIHDDIALDSHEYVVRVRGAEVARGRLLPGHQLAMDPGDAVGQLAGVPTTEPAFGLPAVWIADDVARRGRGARLHRRRRRVGDRHAPHRDDPRARRRAAHASGDAQAARQAQGTQRSCR